MQNNNNNPMKSRTNNASKGSSNNRTNAQEPAQPRSYLANLFREPDDPQEAEAARDKRFGRTPRNVNANSSFSK